VTYPPQGCTYEVTYRLGRRGQGVETFADEYELGAWFLEMTEVGAWDPETFAEGNEEFEGANGFQIFCVAPGERVGISYWHPRLVMGRIDAPRKLKERASNGANP